MLIYYGFNHVYIPINTNIFIITNIPINILNSNSLVDILKLFPIIISVFSSLWNLFIYSMIVSMIFKIVDKLIILTTSIYNISTPFNFMNISFGESYAAEWTFPISIYCGIFYAFLAK